uniref:Monodehydroascorbate reductase n=1 Tax=Tanacetum cinerariifolium TaxID=118510 RepID=A0A6L2L787_TANCI|nr:hypothetical protein [Tanacetum cinerariifolium]
MADVNVNAPAGQEPTMEPPMRTDDQILPHIRWVPIGKSNYYLDVEKSQNNPIYKIVVDILKHTNFFRAFTASSTIPSIYIQQFWDTVRYDKLARCYRCQLDEQWFDLTKDTLRDAIQITPVNNNQAFISPPSSDALINFVNKLGYPKLVRNLSNVVTNDMFQPWRALTTIINLCLMGKTSGFERPRAPEYLEKVAKHQRYLAGEIGSDLNSPAPKPTKTARKPKPMAPKENPRPSVSKPVSSTHPEPTSAPAKPQGKKRKLTTEISNKPYKAIQSRHGFVSKKRKPTSTLRSVDESVAEDVPAKEPRVDDEETDVQRVLEESMKSMYDVPRGPLPPVVIREPEFEKYQPFSEVPGKGKEKVIKEQVARDLLNLQTPKKKSPADRYIFQRRTFTPTGSSRHDESSSLYVELGLTDSEEESKKDVPGADAEGQGEGQAGPDPGALAEGQAGRDPGTQDEGQAGSNPNEQPEGQAGLDLEEPASSSGTLSSLQHLTKDLIFGDLFFSDKPSKADHDKATNDKVASYGGMERGFLSQKESGRGRGVKEKDLNRNKKNTSSGIGVTTKSDDTMNDDTPIGVASAIQEGVTRSGVDMTVKMDTQNSLEDITVPESLPRLTTPVSSKAGNAPGKSSYANITGKPSAKKVNVHTLFTPRGNGIDVVVPVDSIRAVSARFANTAYGFFLGKKVAYPVIANYVRNTWGKYGIVRSMFSSSSYARVMIELRADVELKDNIVVAMSKITREGHYTCNVCVEYKWKPPRCSSRKVFEHIHEDFSKNTSGGEKKTVKKPSQTSRGVLVGPKMGFKPHKEYRHVPKKSTASSCGNKKKGVEPTIEVNNSNPFDVLNSVDIDGEFGTNGGTTSFVNNEATSSGSSFMYVDNDGDFASNTHIGEKIDNIERQICEGKLRLLDYDGNPLVPMGIVESDSELEVVFDETANLRILTSGKDGSDKGYGTNSLLEQ